jgi:hypothetical protein
MVECLTFIAVVQGSQEKSSIAEARIPAQSNSWFQFTGIKGKHLSLRLSRKLHVHARHMHLAQDSRQDSTMVPRV